MKKMFDRKDRLERIGNIEKVTSLEHLKPIEDYAVNKMAKIGIGWDYDVTAFEVPFFSNFGYTEFAHSFIINPLQQELRCQQINDAFEDDSESDLLDWTGYFANRVKSKGANKYVDIKQTEYEGRPHIIIPVGSNKLKDTICLNKLLFIVRTYGKENVYFKPHPLTKHILIGELKDELGEEVVIERDADMFSLIMKADVIHTSHMSESAVYAISLDKKVDPIDVYNKASGGSYYPINRHLFNQPDPKHWVNKTFSNYKSGIFNPEVDPDWKTKMDKYFDYMMAERDKHRYKFVTTTGG